jgi:hypothetical protein
MKLIRLYDVAMDRSFLIELREGDMTLNSLNVAIQERRKTLWTRLIKWAIPSLNLDCTMNENSLKENICPQLVSTGNNYLFLCSLTN